MFEDFTDKEAKSVAICAFGLLNRAFFDNELPTPIIEVGIYRHKNHSALCGICLRPNEYPNSSPNYTILLSIEGILLLVGREVCETWQIALIDTLLHEMVHYYDCLNNVNDCKEDGFHTEAFRDAAVSHGLDCGFQDGDGWAATAISLLGWTVIADEVTDNEVVTLALQDYI